MTGEIAGDVSLRATSMSLERGVPIGMSCFSRTSFFWVNRASKAFELTVSNR